MKIQTINHSFWLCSITNGNGKADILPSRYRDGQSVAVKWGRIKKGYLEYKGEVIEDTEHRKILATNCDGPWKYIVLERITVPLTTCIER